MTTEFLSVFEEAQAILKGHFKLASGLHSDTYFQCAKVFEYPNLGETLVMGLAKRWRDTKIHVVCGPAYGGIIISYALARHLNARAVFVERVEGKFALRRGFQINPDDRVLVAEDVITTGGSAVEALEVLGLFTRNIVGLTSLVNRSTDFNPPVRYESLISVSPVTYKPEECPLCKSGQRIDTPGRKQMDK